jgi:hypothetical protein
MVELVGNVGVDPGMPDGVAPGPFILVGTPEFKNGRLVAFHLDKYDYTFHVDFNEWGQLGQGKQHQVTASSVVHRARPPVGDVKAEQARAQSGFR